MKRTLMFIGGGLALAAVARTLWSSAAKADEGTGSVLETGLASWYGPGFDGKPTASGEIFDQTTLTAASRTLRVRPPTIVDVVNLDNGRTVRVRVNDRGPFHKNSLGEYDRIIDLSRAAAEALDMIGPGVCNVEIRAVT